MVDHLVYEGVDELRAGHRDLDMVCVGFIEVDHCVAYRCGLKKPFVTRPECGGGLIPLGDPDGLFLNVREDGCLAGKFVVI